MQVRIGIAQSPRELELELAEESDQAAVAQAVDAAIEAGTGVLWLEDRRGRRIGVPVERIAFVELGPDRNQRSVGFRA
ncbi:conserved hypothetical protein [Acidimicrobium ferrooxidans DSM 10331]|uniref:ATP-binding protein n=1 Tax=Acidimicrobium ferrooxidans (strain DSM 10331 / JCM 15462 / NBRC 103882 / ICP) TaxID=525909 RepID=C7M2S2_ACIFD|nr:DUF3107 family protein [Acidimicrobium ferrooxidans]ACU53316.1 conserved hypothetical protein [Acidimicrobium ferrooxidans DSM 10331]